MLLTLAVVPALNQCPVSTVIWYLNTKDHQDYNEYKRNEIEDEPENGPFEKLQFK